MLEIKLALEPGVDPPAWVEELVSSGRLTEVHKFSKFMHGCAALFPDVVQEVPYWRGGRASMHARRALYFYKAFIRLLFFRLSPPLYEQCLITL